LFKKNCGFAPKGIFIKKRISEKEVIYLERMHMGPT